MSEATLRVAQSKDPGNASPASPPNEFAPYSGENALKLH
jgi:hypothetical protein